MESIHEGFRGLAKIERHVFNGKQKVAVAEFLGKFPDRVPHLMAVAKSVVDATFEKKCDNGKG